MEQATSSDLWQCLDELERLSAPLPRDSTGFKVLTAIVQQLQVLNETLKAGDAREIVFVCSEQLSSIERAQDEFARTGGRAVADRALRVIRALQKAAHASIALQEPQHHVGKLIHR